MAQTIFATLLLLSMTSSVFAAVAWQPFVLQSFDGRKLDAQAGTLAVRENRDEADSRWIRIGMVRLPSTSSDANAAPIVFLTGGPGIPATMLARVPVYFDLFERLRAIGDVLLIDQRGSGTSLPILTCPTAALPHDFASSDEAMRLALRARVGGCAAYWRSHGIDLRGYSTREIAADVDAARRALAAPRVKLLAFSYGSEVAFELARRWPKTIERVVFASTRAPDTLLKSPAAWDRQLTAIASPLPSMLRDVVARLDQSPIEIKVAEETFRVGGVGLLAVLRSDLTDGRAIPNVVPFVESVQRGDYAAFGTRIQKLHASLGSALNLMTFAVDCSSGWSHERLTQTTREAATAIMRNVNLQWSPDICATVVDGTPVPSPIGRVTVPALFVTGRLDANAPIEQTDRIRKRFTDSTHLRVDRGAHETLPDRDVQNVVLEFLMKR
jgi:pimeloyl-ACP methyl ester carboxylesterase